MTDTQRNMAAAVLLLLLGAGGALLYSTEAQEAYNQLPDDYRKGVDLVLKELGSYTAVRLHFRFFKTVQKSEIESGFRVKYISHNVLLKPTTCAKGTAVSDSSPQRCPFRDDRPMMDCTVCYKTFEAEIETTPKPYVHCIQRPKLTKVMTAARMDHCRKMSYITGSPSLLASEGLEPSK